ncbi:MAG: flagellin [Pseudomonadota bacterium]
MSASVLTNSSAMIALQTLRSTNKGLEAVNSEISTGKKIANAKDGAAVFAISKVMESDVAGFQAISDSLNLGAATVAVASNASAQVGELLNEIKTQIVAANEDNVDRVKIQNEIVSLRNQVDGIVTAAQFNGLNLLDGSVASATILSSLDRDNAGNVTSSSITVTAQNLGIAAGAARSALAGSGGTVAAGGDSVAIALDAGAAVGTENLVIDVAGGLTTGDRIEVQIDDQVVSYTVTAQDMASATAEDSIAANLRAAIDGLGVAGLETDFVAGGQVDFGNTAAGNVDRTIAARVISQGAGGLSALSGVDVSTALGAATALTSIETMIQTVVDAQAALGTAEKRVDLQNDFMSSLIDSFKNGIGALVDADLEEASARLQALQVQQQLGIQALSIANQAPQNILALFR